MLCGTLTQRYPEELQQALHAGHGRGLEVIEPSELLEQPFVGRQRLLAPGVEALERLGRVARDVDDLRRIVPDVRALVVAGDGNGQLVRGLASPLEDPDPTRLVAGDGAHRQSADRVIRRASGELMAVDSVVAQQLRQDRQ